MSTLRHLLPLFFSLLSGLVISQAASRYRAWLLPMDSIHARPVVIASLGDSCVWMTSPANLNPAQARTYIPVNSIESLQFRQKGSVGKWMAIAGATGTLLGATFSMNIWGVPQPTLLIGTGLGLVSGAIMGSTKVKFNIGGKRARYEQLKPFIKAYVVH